jgi:hypothetical protein
MKRLFIQQRDRMTHLQIIGVVLILSGLLALIIIVFRSLEDKSGSDNTFAAVAFFFIMIGFSLTFPALLMSNTKGGYSTLRIAVFMIVCVFVFLCVKIGWNCTDLKDFKLDSTWGVILTAALGSKAIQSWGENQVFSRNQGMGITGDSAGNPVNSGKPLANSSPGPPGSSSTPIHDQGTLSNKPPAKPPAYFKKKR